MRLWLGLTCAFIWGCLCNAWFGQTLGSACIAGIGGGLIALLFRLGR